MKKCLISLLFISLTSAFNLKIPSQNVEINPNYQWSQPLSCEGATGNIVYTIEGLPLGLNFHNNALYSSGTIQSGDYQIKIKAQDGSGNVDIKNLNIKVLPKNQIKARRSFGSFFATETVQQPQKIPISTQILNSNVQNTVTSTSSSSSTSNNKSFLSSSSSNNAANSNNSNGSSSSTSSNNSNLQINSLGSALSQNNNQNSNDINSFSGELNNILSSYGGGIIKTNIANYSGNTYPTSGFPTGRSQDAPTNHQITIIRNQQAQKKQSDKNKITQDDVIKKAILNRSINASKAVANLISLIEQGRANKNTASQTILTLTEIYNSAIKAQRNSQVAVVTAEGNLAKVNGAISSVMEIIASTGQQMDNINANKNTTMTVMATMTSTLKSNSNGMTQFQNELDKKTTQRNQLLMGLDKLNKQLENLNNLMKNANNTIVETKTHMENMVSQRRALQNKQIIADQKIADLKRQLQQAQKQKDNINNQIGQLDRITQTGPGIIANAQFQMNKYDDQINQKKQQIKIVQNLIDAIDKQFPVLKNQIENLRNTINNEQKQMQTLKSTMTNQIDANLTDANNRMSKAKQDLTFLRNKVPQFELLLKQSYQFGNDANTKASDSKANLQAAISRLRQQENNLKLLTAQLEKARQQKEIADLAVEELLAQRTNALPYSLLPSNLPILGANLTSDGSLKITNWTFYLSSTYGSNIRSPNTNSVISQLLPFSFAQQVTISNNNLINGGRTDNFICNGGSGIIQSNEGVITNILPNGFEVKDQNNALKTVQLATCTKNYANVKTYIPKVGDYIIWKGPVDSNSWRAQQTTCIR